MKDSVYNIPFIYTEMWKFKDFYKGGPLRIILEIVGRYFK